MSASLSTADPSASPKRATIKDVAAEAGVSVAAVSKVLRNAYGVSDQMRQRVEAAIKKLDYRPRTGARTMRGSSQTIGLVLTDFSSPFQFEVAEAIASRLTDTPYQDILTIAGTSPEGYRRRIDSLVDLQVDGIVLISPRLDMDSLNRLARTTPLVTVALHGEPKLFDTVVTDEHRGAELMVDHLVSLGHEWIAHTAMPVSSVENGYLLSQTVRRQGFIRAMENRDLAPDVIETYYSESGGRDAARRALARRHRPTAIFAGSDAVAFGVLDYIEEQGLAVPADMSVSGYDNVHATALHRVSLTTIDQSGQQTGQAAIELLLERIEGRAESAQQVIKPTLVVRSTTAPPSATQH
ncbi:LacI family DNA-binding transcriptional regulator [Actinomyces ruminis]|uniref:LacI family transcriptional regulator n=1 Tax=Actinomyces ruminis TaxID=1937003 RepID=A0ABX4MDJ5_9ACTO|nr:LacI family DNA-binding transcriptional regulator [Actinomyces ruminis]PHP53522.1 LacI family transcriptional regulator [Actinomyces ruminis]